MRLIIRLIGLAILAAGTVYFFRQVQALNNLRAAGDDMPTDLYARLGGALVADTVALVMIFWQKVTNPNKVLKKRRAAQIKTRQNDAAAAGLAALSDGGEEES